MSVEISDSRFDVKQAKISKWNELRLAKESVTLVNRRERNEEKGALKEIRRGARERIFLSSRTGREGSPHRRDISTLAPRPRRLLFVMHALADRDVPLRGGPIELPAAVLALDVIAGIAGRRGWQIAQIPTRRQSCLRLPRVANRADEFLVLAPPVRLRLRLLRLRLKTM